MDQRLVWLIYYFSFSSSFSLYKRNERISSSPSGTETFTRAWLLGESSRVFSLSLGNRLTNTGEFAKLLLEYALLLRLLIVSKSNYI